MIKEALNQHAEALERQFNHDRKRTVGASEIGLCARKVAWNKQSGTKNAQFVQGWGSHIRGTVMETAFWQPALRAKYGNSLKYSGSEQQSFEYESLSATPDGLVCNLQRDALKSVGVDDILSDCISVECKTIDPRVNLIKERDANHFQVQVQLGLIRRCTPYKPEYGLISYIDASFWDEVSEFPVKYDEGVFESAQLRASKLLNADPRDLKPEGWIAGGKECDYCPFTEACGIMRRSVPAEDAAVANPQFVAEIADLCREAAELKSQGESMEAEVRDLQQQIKDRLREKKVRRIPGIVVWSPVKGRTNYDMPALRRAAADLGLDVEKFSTAGEPTDQLRILVNRATTAD